MFKGYTQLSNSVEWGVEQANNFLRENKGGSMGTDEYHIMLQSFIEQWRWKGGFLFSLSGIVFVTCIFGFIFKTVQRVR
jgi:hypothetical protein